VTQTFSGGCQCGAVRFRVSGELGRASICHCRMCQKAFGGFFGPLVSVEVKHLTWTRGAPKHFQSSNKVARGFCGYCGTPLTFEWSQYVHEIAIGAFDDPTPIAPAMQNALNERPPEGRNYNYDYTRSSPSPGLPIIPSIGFRAEL